MTGRELVLTGVPRSGTTLCCQLLGRAANTVALFEPMKVHELSLDRGAAIAQVRDFFAESREEILRSGRARSQQIGGKVPDNPIAASYAGSHRARLAELGEISVDKPLREDFTLVVKHNAAFTALLPDIADAFDCHALVRNPLSVLASWNSVDLPVAKGRLPAGERLDLRLAAQLDAEPDLLGRQLLILDWIFGRFSKFIPPHRILRYEHVVESSAAELARITGVPVPSTDLHSRNSNRLYDADACRRYAAALCASGGNWQEFYQVADVDSALDALVGSR